MRDAWQRTEVFRRIFDLTSAAAGVFLLSPVFAGIALTIMLRDGLPVLFLQTRVGRNGKPFRIWKFRTMRTGSSGRRITAAADPRITPTGAFLRKYKLDELPQLINVLKGDMSFVGPRPEVPEYVRLDNPIWRAVLTARPGITDLASLLYRDEEAILGASPDAEWFYREHVQPDKLRLNLTYLRTRSFRRDLALVWLSICYSLFPSRFGAERIASALLPVPHPPPGTRISSR